jgi:hypothetical protein
LPSVSQLAIPYAKFGVQEDCLDCDF